MSPIGLLLMLVAGVLALIVGIVLVFYVLVPVLKAIGWAIAHVFKFIGGEIGDLFRLIGAIITGIVFIPLVIINIIIGRWSASAHFGRAIQSEIKAGIASLYRIFVGHPARLLCLQSLTEGLEKRVPEAMAAAPGRDKPAKRSGQFEGYSIVGSLAGGGSGGRLYVAEPDAIKLASLERSGHADVEQVVIKTFSLHDGSSLPQIVRESRALDAAKKMGLVLEHELTDERFYYVMRYVPGESLALVTQRLHAESGADGLARRQLDAALGYASDLVRTLDAYHRGGLWHKDVKPDNIIVDGQRAHLVDLGLITPLRSAMTLTTHGTEYFRDPELVRLALKGVKVHQVDGAKFDIYAAGAVLYSVIENSFPAHGGLSQVTKRCPEALKWIIRRAMTEYDKRYATTTEMLADLRVLMDADDPFAVRPGALPSMTGEQIEEPVVAHAAHTPPPPPRREAGTPTPPPPPAPGVVRGEAARPKLRVADWWTGRYVVDGEGTASGDIPVVTRIRSRKAVRPVRAHAGHPLGLSAKEQVERARSRADEARRRAMHRMSGRQGRRAEAKKSYSNEINPGGAVALFVFLAACVGLAAVVLNNARGGSGARSVAIAQATGESVPVSTEADAPPMLPALEGSVLVVKEGELSDEARAEIRAFLEQLETSGADVFGAFTDLSESDEAYEDVTHVLAKADLVRDLAPIDSSDALKRLTDWISTEDVADVLVWVYPGEDLDPDDPELWVIPRRAGEGERARINELVDAISRF